jgi:hypothetical protein
MIINFLFLPSPASRRGVVFRKKNGVRLLNVAATLTHAGN